MRQEEEYGGDNYLMRGLKNVSTLMVLNEGTRNWCNIEQTKGALRPSSNSETKMCRLERNSK